MAADENDEGETTPAEFVYTDLPNLLCSSEESSGECTRLNVLMRDEDDAAHSQSNEDKNGRINVGENNSNSSGSTYVAEEEEERRKRNRMLLEELLGFLNGTSISRETSLSVRGIASSSSSSSPSPPLLSPPPPHTPPPSSSSLTRLVDTYGAYHQRCSYYAVEPIQIKLSTADSIVNCAVGDASKREASGVKGRPLPHCLPQQLDVPLALRCDFCRKFDSLCSNCHRKWKETLLQRRHAVTFQIYSRLPEHKRRALLFLTASHGVSDFVMMQLEFDGEQCSKWYSSFFPMNDSTEKLHDAFSEAGDVLVMHVALAYDRTDVVNTLLSNPRFLFLKSKNHVNPLMFLQMPLNPKMETVLNASEVYVNHLLAERAKQMRSMEEWDKAEALYAELLERKSDSEHAHSGLAKMRYDQGYVKECIRLCDSMISGETKVEWNEISVDIIKKLKCLADVRYHEYSHSITTGGVLKTCGCVILERVRISIRCLPFSIVIDNIFPFCEGEVLWNIFNCSKIPLLRNVTEKLTVLLPPRCLQQVLEREPGFEEISVQLLHRLPGDIGTLVVPPVRPLGVFVVAMADFNMFLIRAHFAGVAPNQEKVAEPSSLSFFNLRGRLSKNRHQTTSEVKEVVISKQYRIHRSTVKESWKLKETGEWEIDPQSVKDIETHLKRVDEEFLKK